MTRPRAPATYSSWSETSPRFRSSYEQRYGTSRRWEDVEPAHRFGYESYGRTRQGGTRPTGAPTSRPCARSGAAPATGDWDTHRNDVRRGWDYGRGRTSFRDYDDDLGTEGENAAATGGGALAGGVAGGAAGAVVGGPLGAAAGAVIGGTAGAMAGDAAVKTPRERREDVGGGAPRPHGRRRR